MFYIFGFIFSLLPILAKSSYGWLQLRDHLVSLSIIQIYHPNNTHWFLGFCNFSASWPLAFFFSFGFGWIVDSFTYYCRLCQLAQVWIGYPTILFSPRPFSFFFTKFNFQGQKLFPYLKSKNFKITLLKTMIK